MLCECYSPLAEAVPFQISHCLTIQSCSTGWSHNVNRVVLSVDPCSSSFGRKDHQPMLGGLECNEDLCRQIIISPFHASRQAANGGDVSILVHPVSNIQGNIPHSVEIIWTGSRETRLYDVDPKLGQLLGYLQLLLAGQSRPRRLLPIPVKIGIACCPDQRIVYCNLSLSSCSGELDCFWWVIAVASQP